MGNSNENEEGNSNEENIIPAELIKKENDAIEIVECMEIPEVSLNQEEVKVEANTSTSILKNSGNLKPSNECNIRADCIVQNKAIRGVYFDSTPRMIYVQPDMQPTVNTLPSSLLKLIDPSSLHVRVCVACSVIIQINNYSSISWQARDFCNEQCLTKYQIRFNTFCVQCKISIVDADYFGKYFMKFGNNIRAFCSTACGNEYKIKLNMCQFCNNEIPNDAYCMYLAPQTEHSSSYKQFCTLNCVQHYYHYKLKLPYQNDPSSYANCIVCKEFKLVQVKFKHKDNLNYLFCSGICFNKFQYYNKIEVVKCFICNMLYEKIFFQRYCLYHNGTKNFCGQNCETTYFIMARHIVECNTCKVKKYNFDMIQKTFPNNQTIYTCSFQCLKISYRNLPRQIIRLNCSTSQMELNRLYRNLRNLMNLTFTKNGSLANKKNAATICCPIQKDASTSVEMELECNTDTEREQKITNAQTEMRTIGTDAKELPTSAPIVIPVPVPIPVPIFIPTGCRTVEEVTTKMKKIWEELPQDPLQADLIMLARSLNTSKPETRVQKKKKALSLSRLNRTRKLKTTMKRKSVNKLYNFGFNALKRWIFTRNKQIEKEKDSLEAGEKTISNIFKTNILFMTRDELHKCLIAFLEEMKGRAVHSSATIFTMFLDIQKYLIHNNKQEYIFLDLSFKKFIEDFNEITIDFPNTSNLNSKLTEDYLWKTNQLGTHTPYVLLNSLIYFNFKLFGVKTVQEHLDLLSKQITFTKKAKSNRLEPEANIMHYYRFKYLPKTNNETGKNIPEIVKQFFDRKRCPGLLYEFYIKKCPKNAENGNKSFYLKPELACETNSPIWFSNQPLDEWTIQMMLNRIKMLKEINEA